MSNEPPHGKLASRVAFVTGGGGAIGGAIVRAFAGAGATVIIADARLDAAERVAAEVDRGYPLALDVTDSAAWNAAISSVCGQHAKIDVLVNCAATHLQALVQDTANDDWQRVVDTNVNSVFYGCRAVIPAMRDAGGSIINIVTGQFGVPYSSAYTASKFFVHGFSQCLMLEVARYGIRVNCIAPGSIPNTGFERWYREKADLLNMPYDAFLQSALDAIPLHRFGQADEIANGAVYLASDDAAYVTGHLLSIDGGFAGYAISLPAEED